MNSRRLAIPSVLLLGLGACAATPVHFYTLLPPASRPPASAATPAGFLIDVQPVDLPTQLDQQPLVLRQDASRVAILDHERWASPLGDEIRGALSAGLAGRLGTQDVAGLTLKQDQPVLHVKLQVRRLDAWPDGRVQLDADWSLVLGDGAKAARVVHGGHFDIPAGAGDTAHAGAYPQVARALQQAVVALTQALVDDAQGLAR